MAMVGRGGGCGGGGWRRCSSGRRASPLPLTIAMGSESREAAAGSVGLEVVVVEDEDDEERSLAASTANRDAAAAACSSAFSGSVSGARRLRKKVINRLEDS